MRNSVLWHHNMLHANIFVKDGKITALADWWAVEAAPLLQQAREPGFFRRVTKEMHELPENYGDMRGADEKELMRLQVANSMRQWSYEHATEQMNPALHHVLTHPMRDMLRSTIYAAENTWDAGITPLAINLLKITR